MIQWRSFSPPPLNTVPKNPNNPVLENLNNLDSSWITRVLEEKGFLSCGAVEHVEKIDFNHTPSYFSRIARFSLKYDNEALSKHSHLPQSIIVKVQPENEPFKSVEKEYLAFAREIYFYDRIALHMSRLKLPQCYFAQYDQTENKGIIVFEDLSAQFTEQGDQIKGLSLSQIESAVKSIAYVHAAWWGENLDRLKSAWLPDRNYMMIKRYGEFYPLFEEKYKSKIDSESLAIGKSISQSLDKLLALAHSRPQSLVHCDLRADNMRFNGDTSNIVILDWQLITRALPGFDLGRLLGENAELTQSEQTDLITLWHQVLTTNGVKNYSLEDAQFDYKLGLALATHVPVINAAMLKDANPRTQNLVDIMALRFFKAAKAMQLGDFVQNLQD